MKKGTLKQILLITDGCSNQGEDPVAMAALAFEQGIVVNVIGVMETNIIDKQGQSEIEAIALAGGGVSQVVYTSALSQTVKMVTQKAMAQTLQGIVNQELKQILGSSIDIEQLRPEQRGQIVEAVEEISENSDLEVLVLIDASGSMKPKLEMVKESLFDLSISLNSRIGRNKFSLFTFPGKRKNIEKIVDWSPRLDSLSTMFPRLTSEGLTPTGPALKEATSYFNKKNNNIKGWFSNEKQYHSEEYLM